MVIGDAQHAFDSVRFQLACELRQLEASHSAEGKNLVKRRGATVPQLVKRQGRAK